MPEKASFQPEHLSIAEAIEEVAVAKEIADARSILELEIFEKNLPRGEWRNFFEQKILSAYPRLVPYKKIFDQILKNAEQASKALEDFLVNTEQEEGTKTEKLEDQKINDRNLARLMFLKIFGKEPNGGLEILRGKVALSFVIHDPDDFMFVCKSAGEKPDENGMHLPAAFVYPMGERKFGFPIIIGKRFTEETLAKYEIAHETEHVKTDIITQGRHESLGLLAKEGMEKIISQRLQRWQEKDLLVEQKAADEIVALFGGLTVLRSKPSSNFYENLHSFRNSLEEHLLSGAYYSQYFEILPKLEEWTSGMPVAEQERRYRKNIKNAFDAMERLIRLYNKDIRSAVNLLEMFPLHRWRAVVRLVEMKRRKDEKGARFKSSDLRPR